MNTVRQTLINEYISSINFKKGDWSLKKIKADINKMLGETPAVNLSYDKQRKIDEGSGEEKIIERLECLEISFTDDNDKIKTLKYII